MYFKFYEDGRRKAVDLNDLYLDQTLFILGGSPTLENESLELLNKPGVVTLAINNAATLFKPMFWVGGDRPGCYAKKILLDVSILKFANYGKRDFIFQGKPWKFCPSTIFYACIGKRFNTKNFLERDYRLCWWRNTFFIAIQLAWRLGFRKVNLLGCEFKIDKDHQYPWKTDLSTEEIKANKRLYSNSVAILQEMKPLFEEHGFLIRNCCKTSRLIPYFGYTPLTQAVEDVTKEIPENEDTCLLPHSLRKEK